MDRFKLEELKLLATSGATNSRSKNHEIWLLPDGRSFICSKTPSDSRASRNSLGILRRLLGLTYKGGSEGVRSKKRHCSAIRCTSLTRLESGPLRSIQDQLPKIQIEVKKYKPRALLCKIQHPVPKPKCVELRQGTVLNFDDLLAKFG